MNLVDSNIFNNASFNRALHIFVDIDDALFRNFADDLNLLNNWNFLNNSASDNALNWFFDDFLDLNRLMMLNRDLNDLLNNLLVGDITVLNSFVWNFNLLFNNFLDLILSDNLLDNFFGYFDNTLNWFLDLNHDLNFLNWN